ncbi:hypothetical protein ABWL39_03070 [Chitinivorax sp. PXF-14]|uniref:hypothetical protein n=1 Tax=Chitinivorax sp. PXF-14 TaxID=3230488 RepID=UPI0034658540
MSPPPVEWFHPLFVLLRQVFGDTDICVGATLVLLLVCLFTQWVAWDRYRHAYLGAKASGDYPRFLAHPEPQSGFRFAAPLLTAMGVLGTFGGITAGLAHFGNTDSSQEIIASARTLVEGMKTAFYTSLVGLSSAALFNLFQSALTIQVRKWRRLATEGWQRQAADESRRAHEASLLPMKRTADEVSTLNAHLVTALKLQESLQRAVFDMQKLLKPAVDTMGEALDVLRPLPAAVEDLRVIHGQSMTLLTAAATDLKTFSENIREPFNTFSRTVDDFDGKVNAALQQFAQEFNKALSMRQAEEKALMETYRETFVELQNSAASVMDNARRKLSATLAGLDLHLDAVRQAAETDLERIRRMFDSTLEQQQSRFSELLQTRQQQEAALYQDYRQSFEQIHSRAVGSLDAARGGLDDTLGGLGSQLVGLRQTAADEMLRLRDDFRDGLQGFFAQQQPLLEQSLGHQREGLLDAVSAFRLAFDTEAGRRAAMHAEWEASFGKLVEATGAVGQLAAQLDLQEAQALLTQLSRRDTTLAEQAAKEAQGLREARAALQAVSAQLEDISHHLPSAAEHYFSAASRGTEGFFKQLDGAAERIVTRIDSVVRELVTATQAVQSLSESSQAMAATQQRRLLAKLAEGADS